MASRLYGGGANPATVAMATELLAEGIDDVLWRGAMKEEQQHVTVHRTFANGMQMGYGKDDGGFRMFSRPDPKKPWTELGQWDRSWVTLADRISNLPEWDDAE
jgi:hypothetical protein